MVEDWEIGVRTSCLSSFLGTLGVQWRILSLHYEDNELLRSRCLQALGWAFWLTGQALGQVAIMLTPSTIVACVQFSSCLFFNAVLAPFVLHEHLTWKHGLGILLLSGGGCTVTEVSTHSDQEYTLDQLYAFGQRPFFLCTMAICFGAALALTVHTGSRRHLDSVSFAYFWALCGAIDLLLTKFTLLMLRLWAEAADVAEATTVPSPLVLACFVAIMLLSHLVVLACQVVSTNFGEALQNMPLFMASGAMMQVALGGIFFDEFRDFGARRFTLFYVGFSLMLAGLGVTSQAQASAQPLSEPPLSEPLVAPQKVVDVRVISGETTWRNIRKPSADLLLVGGAGRTAMCFGTSWGPHALEPRTAVDRTQSDFWDRAEGRSDAVSSRRCITDPNLNSSALRKIALLTTPECDEDERSCPVETPNRD